VGQFGGPLNRNGAVTQTPSFRRRPLVRWPAARHGPEQRIELILDFRPTRFCGWPPAQSTRKVTDCLGSRRIQMTFMCRPFLRVFCLALLTVASIGAAGDAFAQKPSQSQINAMRQSCRSDYMAHCSSVPTGGAPALNCLKQNLANLSPGRPSRGESNWLGFACGSCVGYSSESSSPSRAGTKYVRTKHVRTKCAHGRRGAANPYAA